MPWRFELGQCSAPGRDPSSTVTTPCGFPNDNTPSAADLLHRFERNVEADVCAANLKDVGFETRLALAALPAHREIAERLGAHLFSAWDPTPTPDALAP